MKNNFEQVLVEVFEQDPDELMEIALGAAIKTKMGRRVRKVRRFIPTAEKLKNKLAWKKKVATGAAKKIAKRAKKIRTFRKTRPLSPAVKKFRAK